MSAIPAAMTAGPGYILGCSSRLVLAGAGILILLGIALAIYEHHFAAEQRSREIREEAAILAQAVAAAVQFGDRAEAEDYLTVLDADPQIRAAAIYNIRGISMATVSRDRAMAPMAFLRTSRLNHSEQIELLVPVMQGGVRIGTVYMSAWRENPGMANARLAGIAVLVGMAALVLGVLALDRAAFARANRELEKRATDLVAATRSLESEAKVRRDAQEALHQSQKMEAIGQLSGGMAHDLNNYLAVIRGSLRLLERRASHTGADVQPYMTSALEGVDRAAGLTRRLLAFARRQPLLPQAVAPEELISGMLDFIKRTVGESVVIETRFESSWLINCDPNQMETVILNLAINARDAMPNGGRLVISTCNRTVRRQQGAAAYESGSGDYVEITVRDNGTGMTEDVRKKAMEPFFTTKPQGQGTGLGLSTALLYIRQSGGSLAIESSLGTGTAITILMPRHLAQHRSHAAQDVA